MLDLTKEEAAALLCESPVISEYKIYCYKCPLLPEDGTCTEVRKMELKNAVVKLRAYIEGEPNGTD